MDTTSNRPALPDDVLAAIAQAFPGDTIGPLQPTVGGYSNLTVILPLGGRRLVAKVAHTPLKRADVRHEARVLATLHDSGLPLPELVAIIDEADFTLELLRYIEGDNAIRFFNEEQSTLPQIYAAIGHTLAAVHRHTIEGEEYDLLPRYAETQAALGALHLPLTLARALHAALDHPIWQHHGTRLVHGDAGLHNVLWHGHLRALLDWEWAGRGLPLLDIAWTAWIMRFRTLPAAVWDAFCAAYNAHADQPVAATPADLRALALSQVAAILTRTAPDTWARGEWQRRAEASIAFPFPSFHP